MKVLLFTNYGGYVATEKMLKIMDKYDKFIECRTGEIIDYIENNCEIYHISYMDEIENKLKKDKELIIRLIQKESLDEQNNIYLVWNKETNHISTFSIIEVDIDRPWTIKEYDGSEYISYLDKWHLSDKELNFYEYN